ncbi:MAG: 2-oxoglutarate dehydrogenase complex dihydrolipoyllysine-residue succinyltransferase [Saprospiraceae bacterium]|nr:2-oxoglutarate dehydrogenase complex dihydrolipoyllysine-residue succinyltransferase [Saprospiraceae bacterium]
MSVVEMKVPVIGESINEVTLSQWLKGNGEYVELDEPICEFESDKATLEFPAEASGKLIWVADQGADLEIGALVAKIDTTVEKPNTVKNNGTPHETVENEVKSEIQTPDVAAASPSYAEGLPSPAAAKLIREQNIDPANISGTGRDGRITKEDVVSRKEDAPQKPEHEVVNAAATTKSGNMPFGRGERREKMSRMRRTIAARLVSAKNNTAMLTTFNEVDMTEILALRKKYQEDFVAQHGIKLGFMSLFAKACAQVLKTMPQVNAHIDGDELIYHDYVDVSIAISTPTGLVVPPVHNVESLDFHEVEFAIKDLAEKAREGRLSLEEMRGGTFTITNGGVFGSLLSTPILNEPQSAILGMHTIQERPVAVDGKVEIRPMMYVALSYDHRVIDGSSSVTFLVKVKELLEDPIRLFMQI